MIEEKIEINDDFSITVTHPAYRDHLLFTSASIKEKDAFVDCMLAIARDLLKAKRKGKSNGKLIKRVVKHMHALTDAVSDSAKEQKREQVHLIEQLYPILSDEEYGLVLRSDPVDNEPTEFTVRIMSYELAEKLSADS